MFQPSQSKLWDVAIGLEIATFSFANLYIMIIRASLRLFKCCNMSTTLDVFRFLLRLLITPFDIFKLVLQPCVGPFRVDRFRIYCSGLRQTNHTTKWWSNERELYACSFTEVELALYAWFFHFKSLRIVRPIFCLFGWMTMEDVVKFDPVLISSDRQYFTFVCMKAIFYFPSHVASLSKSCCKSCTSMVYL